MNFESSRAYHRDSHTGRTYFSYFERTGMAQPALETTCLVRDVILRQVWHWIWTHRTLGTRVRPWAIFLVLLFASGGIIFPDITREFVIWTLIVIVLVSI